MNEAMIAYLIRTGELHENIVEMIRRTHRTRGGSYHPRGILRNLTTLGIHDEAVISDPALIAELEALMSPKNYHTYQQIADVIIKYLAERVYDQ